jgi:hypothetical protein
VPFPVASHRQIGDGHSYEATGPAALRRPIDDSTGVLAAGHAFRTVPLCAGCPSAAHLRTVVCRCRWPCHPTTGQMMSAAAPFRPTPKPFGHQRTRGGRQPSAPCSRRPLELKVALCVRQLGPIRVIGERRPTGRRDELRRHPFWGARKKSRQKLARRKCRRTATLGENGNSPQISLWAVVLDKSRRRPTLPRGLPLSTIGAGGLNCRVRKGNGCVPTAMATGNLLSRGSTHYGRP